LAKVEAAKTALRKVGEEAPSQVTQYWIEIEDEDESFWKEKFLLNTLKCFKDNITFFV
jgi:hypothetical protein